MAQSNPQPFARQGSVRANVIDKETTDDDDDTLHIISTVTKHLMESTFFEKLAKCHYEHHGDIDPSQLTQRLRALFVDQISETLTCINLNKI